MWYEGLFEELEALRDEDYAVRMAAYMRNQFPFLGISAVPRRAVCKPYFSKAKKEKIIDFDFVDACFAKKEREFHTVAIDYLSTIKALLGPADLPKLKQLILTHSWWDSVDALVTVVGSILYRHPELKPVMLEWSTADNFLASPCRHPPSGLQSRNRHGFAGGNHREQPEPERVFHQQGDRLEPARIQQNESRLGACLHRGP